MAAEHLLLKFSAGVLRMAEYWCDIVLSEADADKISGKRIVGSDRTGSWGDDHNTTSVSAIIWLKSRMRELGLFPHGGVDRQEVRVVTPIHFEKLVVEPADIPLWCQPENLSRSKIFRSPLSKIEPIDRVASKLTQFHDTSRCPYCNRYYRNGAALRLHVVESHGVTQ